MLNRLLKPLTVAQAMSSAAGATPMLVAAIRMQPTNFTEFAVIALASSLGVGGARAALLQPALIRQRTDPNAMVPLRYAAVTAVVVSVCVGGLSLWSAGMALLESAVIAVAAAGPVLHDWLRYRRISNSQRWLVAAGDGVRLMAVLSTAMPLVPPTPVAFMVVVAGSSALSACILATRLPRTTTFARYSSYRRSAIWQVLDFVVGQCVLSIPLIMLTGTASGTWVAGARIAQTLVGPLNLVFAATSTNLVADASTAPEFRQISRVIARGWRASFQLASLAGASVALLATVLWLSGFSPSGVSRESMFLGVVLVGAATTLTGWSGIHAIVLRVLDYQSAVTWTRLGIAASTMTAFGLGLVLDGERSSLIAGFSTNALIAPAAMLLVAVHHYRRERHGEQGDNDSSCMTVDTPGPCAGSPDSPAPATTVVADSAGRSGGWSSPEW